MSDNFSQRRELETDALKAELEGCWVIGYSGFIKPPRGTGYMIGAEKCIRMTLGPAYDAIGNRLRVLYGAAQTGMDSIIERLCATGFIPPTCLYGISSFQDVEWVTDLESLSPVVVCDSTEQKTKLFTDSLHMLVITGGNEHALEEEADRCRTRGIPILANNCTPELTAYDDRQRLLNAAAIPGEFDDVMLEDLPARIQSAISHWESSQ